MFKLLKGLFKKNETEDEVAFSDIDDWFENKIREKLDLYENLDSILSSINDESRKLQTSLSVLQKAELKNSNIPLRASQLMEGNRESYIRKVSDFLKQVEVPEKKNLPNLLSFTDKLVKLTTELNKATVKQYYIMQEFFANESKEVALGIKKIDELGKEITNLVEQDNGFRYINNIRESINNINKKFEEKKRLKEQIELQETKLKEAKGQKEKLETDLDNLETSSRFESHSNAQSTKISTETEMRRHKENFLLIFSQVEKALKKYQKVAFDSDQDIVQDYLISPVEALDNDRSFKILNVLKNISYKINELELDEKKKERTSSTITRINEVMLKDFLWKYDSLKDKLTEVSKRLNSNTVTSEINDINYKLKHSQEQIIKIESDIEKISSSVEEMGIEQSVKDLRVKLNELAPVVIL
ncbi:hypothetical protein ACFLZ7_02390 [Nanoarchaeota archaeon]